MREMHFWLNKLMNAPQGGSKYIPKYRYGRRVLIVTGQRVKFVDLRY